MKLVVFIGLCALALAKIPSSDWEEKFVPNRSIQEHSFKSGKEYKFHYNGQLTTGIPESSKQNSATRIQAIVSLTLEGENEAILEIERCRWGKLNQRIPTTKAILPFRVYEQVEVNSQLQKVLKAPVKFQYNKGMITDVVFDGEEQPWSANIKRGILHMLQVNLHKDGQIRPEQSSLRSSVRREERRASSRSSPSSSSSASEMLEFFTTKEKTMEGNCEVQYTLSNRREHENRRPIEREGSSSEESSEERSSYSGPVLSVTKSIDHENCEDKPEVKYNWRFQEPCPYCEDREEEMEQQEEKKFLKASTVSKIQIRGNKQEFLVQRVQTTSQYQFVPFSQRGNMVTSTVLQELDLVKSGPQQGPLRRPKNPVESDSDMIYSPDWDIEKEELFMEGEESFLKNSPYSELKNKNQFVGQILKQLVSEMEKEVEVEAPRQYLRLVKILRMLKGSEIQSIHQEYFSHAGEHFTHEQHQKVRELLVDALADAATKETISHLIEKINEKHISPVRGAVALKQLINTRVVSQSMIRQMLEFRKSSVARQNPFLKQSIYLTMGSMVNALCEPNEDKLATEFKEQSERASLNKFCPRSFQEELLRKLFEEFDQTESNMEKVLILKTIGNMGLSESVQKLEKIIKKQSPYHQERDIIRLEAMTALQSLGSSMPRKVQELLMPVFMCRHQSTRVRIAAVYEILQTQPRRSILDQIARKMFSERNTQVSSFVYSYMKTTSRTSNPCQKEFARDLQLSLRQGRKISGAYYPSQSKHLHTSAFSRKYKLGVDFNFNTVLSRTTSIPNVLYTSINVHALQQWSRDLLAFGVMTSNMDSLVSKFLGPQGSRHLNLEDLVRTPRSSQTTSPRQEIRSLWQKLKTAKRSMSGTPEGLMLMKFKGQNYALLPFDLDTMVEQIESAMRQGSSYLRSVERFLTTGQNFQFAKAAILHEMSYKIPTSLGMPLSVSLRVPVVMQVSGQVKGELGSQNQKVELELKNTRPSLVISTIVNIQCWSPITNSGLKVVGNVKLNVPINGKVELDMSRQQPKVQFKWSAPTEPTTWMQFSTRPITYTRVWPKFLSSWQEPEERTITGEKWTRQYNFEKDFPMMERYLETYEKIMGIKLEVEGTWHNTPSMRRSDVPICPLSGPNRISIRTKPTSRQPSQFQTSFSGRYAYLQSSPLSRSVSSNMEEFLRSESSSEEQINENWNQYSPSSQHYESSVKVEMKTKGQEPREAEWEGKVKCDPEMRLCKFKSTFERTPIAEHDSSPFKLCTEAEVLYSKTPKSFQQISGRKTVGQIETTWGQSCSSQKSENFLNIKIQSQRSRQQQKRMEEEQEYRQYSEENCQGEEEKERCSPVSLYRTIQKAARHNSLEVEAEYQNLSPSVKRLSQKVYRGLKHWFYWNSQVDDVNVRNSPNKIQLRLSIDSRRQDTLNVTIKTPKEKVSFKDIPLPMRYRSSPRYSSPSSRSLFRSSRMEELEEESSPSFSELMSISSSSSHPMCQVNSRRVETFDNTEYQVRLSDCWTVLSKDCRDEQFAVLMKKISPNSSQKKVKILSPTHKIVLISEKSEYGKIKVEVNGEEKSISESQPETFSHHNHEVLKIQRKSDEKSIMVYLPEQGIRVYFDGYTASIKSSPLLQSTHCGLCGDNDGNSNNDFYNPENHEEHDVRSFFQKYTVKESSCQYPQEVEQICSSPECRSESRWENNQEESSWESQEEEENNQRRRSTRPVERTLVIEQNSKVCFSKSPVPVCPHNTYPSQHEEKEKKVIFACIPETQSKAQRLLRKVRIERQTPEEISELRQSFTENYPWPKNCERY